MSTYRLVCEISEVQNEKNFEGYFILTNVVCCTILKNGRSVLDVNALGGQRVGSIGEYCNELGKTSRFAEISEREFMTVLHL